MKKFIILGVLLLLSTMAFSQDYSKTTGISDACYEREQFASYGISKEEINEVIEIMLWTQVKDAKGEPTGLTEEQTARARRICGDLSLDSGDACYQSSSGMYVTIHYAWYGGVGGMPLELYVHATSVSASPCHC